MFMYCHVTFSLICELITSLVAAISVKFHAETSRSVEVHLK